MSEVPFNSRHIKTPPEFDEVEGYEYASRKRRQQPVNLKGQN